jgi:hypothetical protein
MFLWELYVGIITETSGFVRRSSTEPSSLAGSEEPFMNLVSRIEYYSVSEDELLIRGIATSH